MFLKPVISNNDEKSTFNQYNVDLLYALIIK